MRSKLLNAVGTATPVVIVTEAGVVAVALVATLVLTGAVMATVDGLLTGVDTAAVVAGATVVAVATGTLLPVVAILAVVIHSILAEVTTTGVLAAVAVVDAAVAAVAVVDAAAAADANPTGTSAKTVVDTVRVMLVFSTILHALTLTPTIMLVDLHAEAVAVITHVALLTNAVEPV